jgi:hypothetical protein
MNDISNNQNQPIEKPWVIYVLIDPRDGRVRYVGKTCDVKVSAKMSASRRLYIERMNGHV